MNNEPKGTASERLAELEVSFKDSGILPNIMKYRKVAQELDAGLQQERVRVDNYSRTITECMAEIAKQKAAVADQKAFLDETFLRIQIYLSGGTEPAYRMSEPKGFLNLFTEYQALLAKDKESTNASE